MQVSYALMRDDLSRTDMVNATSDFAAMVFARARGYLAPRVVAHDPQALDVGALRAVERAREETRAFWQGRD